MKKFMKGITATAAIAALYLIISISVANYFTPDSFQVAAGQDLDWNMPSITAVRDGNSISKNSLAEANQSYKAKLMLYNIVPVKTVDVNVVNEPMLIPCGTPFGIKLFTNGVVIVGVADIQTSSGAVNPASISGIKVGDVITSVNEKAITTNSEIAALMAASEGKKMKLTIRRDNVSMNVDIQPVLSQVDNTYKAGLWVRDSTAGIGTLTFYNPATKSFGGLGHGVCDTDTNELMPLLNGDILPVTINGISKGERGAPGELRGYFSTDDAIGSLQANEPSGVFGVLYSAPKGKAMPVGLKQDVKPGAAKILTTIDGKGPQYYDVQIEKIDYRDSITSKNLVLHITDQKLLNKTGGIIQGMSGSPILQNGKLVGAVTHVFVNDPTRGYGVFAENMLTVAQKVNSNTTKKAS